MKPTPTNPEGSTSTKRKDAAVLLKRFLADGEWHRSEDVGPPICTLVPCKIKAVTNALNEIGGEYRRRPGFFSRYTDWRLPLEADDGSSR